MIVATESSEAFEVDYEAFRSTEKLEKLNMDGSGMNLQRG
jgi:hypothetical protein